MSPVDWATRPLKKYADFSGRAPRAEFWWYVLLVLAAAIVVMILESMLGLEPVMGLYAVPTLLLALATFVPTLAVQIRRLHDTGKSGYWVLPFYIGYAILLYQLSKMLPGVASQTPDTSGMASLGLVSLVLGIYAIVLIVFFASGGTRGPNKYGEDPYGGSAATV